MDLLKNPDLLNNLDTHPAIDTNGSTNDTTLENSKAISRTSSETKLHPEKLPQKPCVLNPTPCS